MDDIDSILNGQVRYSNLVLRVTETSSSTASDHTCGPNVCEKPTSSSTFTLPIILGVAVPLCGAAILFLILQRRHTRKQREEDANDRTASLDFGMGDVPQPGRQNTSNGYQEEEKSDLSRHQVSMDLTMVNNPYLPSPGLNNSRKSLQSLSKSIEHEDPYRPVPQYSGSDATSLRPQPKQTASNSSLAPTKVLGQTNNLANSYPVNDSQSQENSFAPPIDQVPLSQNNYSIEQPSQAYFPNSSALVQNGWEIDQYPVGQPDPGVYYSQNPQGFQGQQMDYSGTPSQSTGGGYLKQAEGRYTANSSSGSIDREPTLPSLAVDPPPLLIQEHQFDQRNGEYFAPDNSSTLQYPTLYGEVGAAREQQFSTANISQSFPEQRLSTRIMDPNRISMGFRPLPPDNFIEADDPEVRANRIRSFYKEYFDDSTPAPVGKYAEDYNDYYGEEYGSFVPYSQPMTRRAMTPPPEGARYRPEHGKNRSIGASSYSAGRREPHQFHPEVRPHSSASGRIPPGHRRPMPPPAELSNLPTPAKLKDDALSINPVDFAPPSLYRGAGRLERPQGERPPFLSFASNNQELAPIPSPHMLRNSKSFTSLDFAPPRKFNNVDNSDAGSIRSNRSGLSSSRNRAYTENLLPQETLKTSLRPQWDMSGR
ncbi:hypothetical protein K3495_g5360 [Podosphaera aphanis]|nr:hypothetical protein K3495_g5360 [Podosphaera aphanis]